jgi:hypothetical protein
MLQCGEILALWERPRERGGRDLELKLNRAQSVLQWETDVFETLQTLVCA